MVVMARRGTHALGGLWRDTATRLMALIIVAMGVQFALTGVRDFWLAHPETQAMCPSATHIAQIPAAKVKYLKGSRHFGSI
jgi:hypothetical protein